MASSSIIANHVLYSSPKNLIVSSKNFNSNHKLAIKSANIGFAYQNSFISETNRIDAENFACSRSISFNKRLAICIPRAMDASLGSSGGYSVFPRISVKDPYKRLGLGRDASTEEIQEARNYLFEQYGSHEQSREAIEDAFDKIIAEKLRIRKKTKMNLKADLKKKVAESPPWVQSFFSIFESPPSSTIFQRFILFALIAVWSVMNPTEGGPTFQVAVALGAAVYLLNDKVKSLGRAFFLGFVALVIGWVTGSICVPLLQDILPANFWSLELGTALISYVFLWLVTTFVK